MGFLNENSGMTLAGRVPDGTCPECAVKHDPSAPHNRGSLVYQYKFYDKYGRWPSWADAMAHCTEDEPEDAARDWNRSMPEMTNEQLSDSKAVAKSLRWIHANIEDCGPNTFEHAIHGYLSEAIPILESYDSLNARVERLQSEAEEQAQAMSEGHVTVLPCNLGATVYWISRFGTGIKQGTVIAIKISKFGFDLEISQNQDNHLTIRREFEKVFLTYEEAAEAAMGRC